jgi:uncharacterized protein YgiM (DUF1202 family)
MHKRNPVPFVQPVALFGEKRKMKPPVLLTKALFLFAAVFLSPAENATAGAAPAAAGQEALGFCRLEQDKDLWSGPSSNFRVLKKAQAGSLLEILESKGEYFKVRVPDSFPCWVHSDFILYGEDMIGTITGSRVHLRSIPSKKGDYPILKVDRGEILLVWEAVDGWVRVTAPEEAYAYVLRSAVTSVAATADVIEELALLRKKARKDWEDHVAALRSTDEAKQAEDHLAATFNKLEAAAVGQFAGVDLDETRRSYEAVVRETGDDVTKKLAEARIREIDALLDKREMEQALKEKDDILREREQAARLDNQKAAVKRREDEMLKTARTVPEPGSRLTVLGRVDASGSTIVLRGGRFKDAALYYVSCPDRRYTLKDFHDKRIAIQGSVERIVPGELPRIRIARIEILP